MKQSFGQESNMNQKIKEYTRDPAAFEALVRKNLKEYEENFPEFCGFGGQALRERLKFTFTDHKFALKASETEQNAYSFVKKRTGGIMRKKTNGFKKSAFNIAGPLELKPE